MAFGRVCTHILPVPPMTPVAQVKSMVNGGTGVAVAGSGEDVLEIVGVVSEAEGDAVTSPL